MVPLLEVVLAKSLRSVALWESPPVFDLLTGPDLEFPAVYVFLRFYKAILVTTSNLLGVHIGVVGSFCDAVSGSVLLLCAISGNQHHHQEEYPNKPTDDVYGHIVDFPDARFIWGSR
jgi:hypothetical protein